MPNLEEFFDVSLQNFEKKIKLEFEVAHKKLNLFAWQIS